MGASSSPRSRFVAFVAAFALTITGLVALVSMPQPAQAETVTPGVKADFVLKPGDSIAKEFSKPMVGTAEVRPTPDPCRTNPALGLTCATHRIKLTERKEGYFLRFSVSWLAQSAAGTAVPDVDIYLFFSPTGSFAYEKVGGASAAMPEQIKLDSPEQNEYDLVIGPYAGAIASYKVVAEYVNVGKGPTPAAADITLSASQVVKKRVTTPMVGYTGAPALYPVITWNPDECRNDPTRAAVCDVYRLKLNRNKAKDATNFVVIEATWEATYTPDLAVVAAGLNGLQNPNLDIIVWDAADHAMERDVVGGQESTMPERAAFLASQDEYDLVIQLSNGVLADYTLRAYMSNEVFDKPFESLEQLEQAQTESGGNAADGGDISGFGDSSVDPDIPALDLAPINPDADIAGIGLGVSEQFDGENLSLGGAARNTSVTREPPSGIVLVMALAVVPLLIGVGAVGALRRRRQAIF